MLDGMFNDILDVCSASCLAMCSTTRTMACSTAWLKINTLDGMLGVMLNGMPGEHARKVPFLSESLAAESGANI